MRQTNKNCTIVKVSFYALAALLSLSFTQSAIASWFGPENYSECVLDKLSGDETATVARIVEKACRKKFPEKIKRNTIIQLDPKLLPLITGKAGPKRIGGGIQFSGTLYNGVTNFSITEFNVLVSAKNSEESDKSYSYRVVQTISPNSTANFNVNIISYDQAEYSWYIESARGYCLIENCLDQQSITSNKNKLTSKNKPDLTTLKSNGEVFLISNKNKEGVKTTKSGLQYKVVRQGHGKQPNIKDTVSVHYEGSLTDGTIFDSSRARNDPAEFPVAAVIPGFSEGLQLMREGSIYQFFIPSNLAYERQALGKIGPHSVLIFETELIRIEKSSKK